MKYAFSLLITVTLLSTLISCTKTGLVNNFNFNGKVASELTGEGIPGARIFVAVLSHRHSGSYVYDALLDSFNVYSDASGNFSCNIRYNDEPYIYVRFYKADDSYSTAFISPPLEASFLLSELKDSSPVTFYVRKYAPLAINVKNIHPFDDEDAVNVKYVQEGTNYSNNNIVSIQNFGIDNQPQSYPAADDGKNPYWIGMNVNSVIEGKLQEGTTYQIMWDVRRGGINTTYKSEKFVTSLNTLNTYDVLY